jgi:hypothetical protein
MENFRGDPAQYERLVDRLRDLYKRGIKSVALEGKVEQEARLLGADALSRTDLDKLRKGIVKRPREFEKAVALWNVLFSGKYGLPEADASETGASGGDEAAASPHEYFHASVRFFHVHQQRKKRVSVDLLGRFAFYHYSETFHRFSDALPRAVVVGQWDIGLEGGAYCVEEKQAYDGSLGKRRMRDAYTGCCLPKGPNICLIMRHVKTETPKFYVLEMVHEDPHTYQTEVMEGYMLKGSKKQKFFRSPVYAVRVPPEKDVECNIFRPVPPDVPPDVLHELEALSKR